MMPKYVVSCSQVTTQRFLKNATTSTSVTTGVRIFDRLINRYGGGDIYTFLVIVAYC